MTRPGQHGPFRAFTLIELLIVVAIIAALAAILFPVFLSARKRAYRTACAANLKQIGLAMALYAGDNDEKLMPGHPLPVPDPVTGNDSAGWAGADNVYARAPRVFICPTDGGTAQTVGGETFFPLTYFFNVNLSASQTPGGLPLSALTAPSATVLVTEVTGGFMAQPARLNDPDERVGDGEPVSQRGRPGGEPARRRAELPAGRRPRPLDSARGGQHRPAWYGPAP